MYVVVVGCVGDVADIGAVSLQCLWMLFVVEQGVDDARYVVAVDVSLFVLLSRWCHVGVVGSDFGVVLVVIFTLLLLLVLRLTLRVLVLPFAFLQ